MRHKYRARLFKDKRTVSGPTFFLLRQRSDSDQRSGVQVYTAHIAATTTTARWPADRQHKLWLRMMSAQTFSTRVADVFGSLGKMLRVEFRTRGVNFKQR
jgi:hypothetical protein